MALKSTSELPDKTSIRSCIYCVCKVRHMKYGLLICNYVPTYFVLSVSWCKRMEVIFMQIYFQRGGLLHRWILLPCWYYLVIPEIGSTTRSTRVGNIFWYSLATVTNNNAWFVSPGNVIFCLRTCRFASRPIS